MQSNESLNVKFRVQSVLGAFLNVRMLVVQYVDDQLRQFRLRSNVDASLLMH